MQSGPDSSESKMQKKPSRQIVSLKTTTCLGRGSGGPVSRVIPIMTLRNTLMANSQGLSKLYQQAKKEPTSYSDNSCCHKWKKPTNMAKQKMTAEKKGRASGCQTQRSSSETGITNSQPYLSMLLIILSKFQVSVSYLSMLWKMDLLCTISLKSHYEVIKGFISGHIIYSQRRQKHLVIGITGRAINYTDK